MITMKLENGGKEVTKIMRDDRNYHQRLQELIDCFMETDPKAELEKASKGVTGVPTGDPDELALKFLGLGIFYGVTEKAKNISLQRAKDGKVLFTVQSRGKYQLPPPKAEIADRIISIARSITHIEDDHGKEPVSVGIRNDRMDITFQFQRKGQEESFLIHFPEL
jgi:hypothetical protein